ncbi:MAG: HNH endonuclease signature motif containing protein [Oscillospiraceae bacterium]|nr:HNH endonuclease signature motif containing protein [Oscillospiraceae bacterium]
MGNTVPSSLNNTESIGSRLKFNNVEFRPYDDMYYVSQDGDIYSTYKRGLLKHNIDHDGYHRVDIHGKHIKVHRLVYLVWRGEIPSNKQVNHHDDNKDNNNYLNLYLGNQEENIGDCIKNGHRLGHVYSITVFDKRIGKEITFTSIKDFIDYTGHHVQNSSLSHIKNKKWFKERFSVVKREGVTTIESYKSIRAKFNSGVKNKVILHEASRVV